MKKKFKIRKNKFGFYQIYPSPSQKQITKFYADEFYSGEYKNFNDSALEVQLKDKEFFNGRWQDVYENLLEIKKKFKKGSSILDIGCGWGLALQFFKKKGFSCYGFDPAPEAIEYGKKKGLNLINAGLSSMNVFGKKKFDIISLINVLEHLADPEFALKQIKNILKKNGVLIIDVPNEFNKFQLAGKKVHQLNEWWVAPPNHLNYFSRDSLVNLLKHLGFKIKLCESSFPLEIFLLFGENYVSYPSKGKVCHKKRVLFETNLRKTGNRDILKKFYRSLASLNLGRQIVVYATLK